MCVSVCVCVCVCEREREREREREAKAEASTHIISDKQCLTLFGSGPPLMMSATAEDPLLPGAL
jgi:hypothetical protein